MRESNLVPLVEQAMRAADVVSTDVESPVPKEWLDDIALRILRSSTADNTKKTYVKAWLRYRNWCTDGGLVWATAHRDLLLAFIDDQSRHLSTDGTRWRYSNSTLQLWASAIPQAYEWAGLQRPDKDKRLRDLLRSVRAERAKEAYGQGRGQKEALLLHDIRELLAIIHELEEPGSPTARRDACILLIGFAAALRRSEIAALQVRDVTLRPGEGLRICVGSSKGDQEGHGLVKAIPYGTSYLTCVPCAVVRWREMLDAYDAGGRTATLRLAAQRDEVDRHLCRDALLDHNLAQHRPLFRSVTAAQRIGASAVSADAINNVIKRWLTRARYDPTEYGGHSLRAGFVTQALNNNSSTHSILRQTGHKTPSMIEVYARERTPLRNNAVTDLGL